MRRRPEKLPPSRKSRGFESAEVKYREGRVATVGNQAIQCRKCDNITLRQIFLGPELVAQPIPAVRFLCISRAPFANGRPSAASSGLVCHRDRITLCHEKPYLNSAQILPHPRR